MSADDGFVVVADPHAQRVILLRRRLVERAAPVGDGLILDDALADSVRTLAVSS